MRHRPSVPSLVPMMACVLALLGCSESGGAPDAGGDAGPPPVDQCTGASDSEIVAMVNGDAGTADGGVLPISVIGRDCAKVTCLDVILANGDVDACMNACFESSEAAGLTQGCRDCYIQAVYCGQAHCVIPCIGDDLDLCTSCLRMYCTPRMNECTGI